ncbi:MAG TPA: DUF4097 family beta strand repeat-containing protein [Thermoanaerobaculia bacterium]|jgi:hypothetical protein|nr:DUF4097 family beta strand repeat-containing protein [Thermoanaerobaculia bacterium]
MRKAIVSLALMLLLAAGARAQGPNRYVVPLSKPGQPVHLTVGLVSGSISVQPGDANQVVVEVVGDTDSDDGHPAKPPHGASGMRRLPNRSLGLVVEEEANKVGVSMGGMPSDVTLRIQVPRQTSVALSTVNDGDIHVEGLEGTLELSNVNGEITAKGVAGSVVAHTTNGDVKVTMTRVDPKAALAFASFNGDVDVSLPASFRGDLRIRSDNGKIYTDFDVQLSDQPARVEQKRNGGRYRLEVEQEVRGTIGGGGPEIQLRTFNGDIYLRKHG